MRAATRTSRTTARIRRFYSDAYCQPRKRGSTSSTPMKHPFPALAAALAIAAATALHSDPVLSAQGRGAPRPSFGEPGISPDGSTVAFVSGGDIWEVPAAGGDARLLV